MKFKISSVASTIVLALYSSTVSAQISRSCEFENDLATSASQLLRCVSELSIRLRNSEEEVKFLQREIFSLQADQSNVAIPSGAVVAFDTPKGCPIGWRQYRQLSGRVIVGTGRAGNQDGNGDFLTEREIYESGGMEVVKLTEREIPAHTHRQVWGQNVAADRAVASGNNLQSYRESTMEQSTRSTGGGQPHENMPPYFALHYCIKD